MSKFKQWLDKKLNADGALPIRTSPAGSVGMSSNQQRVNPMANDNSEDDPYTQLHGQLDNYLQILVKLIGKATDKNKLKEVLDQVTTAVHSKLSQNMIRNVSKQATLPPARADAGTTPGM